MTMTYFILSNYLSFFHNFFYWVHLIDIPKELVKESTTEIYDL